MARPREFEPDDALDAVMDVFWRKGFEGASMQDIEAATGLNKQSLYRAFGDKRAMYLAALRRYDDTEIATALDLLAASGAARTKIKRLFDAMLAPPGKGDRRGCFLCNASTDQGQLDGAARAAIEASIAKMEKGVREALAASPPYDADVTLRKQTASKILAGYLGLRVLVRAGAPETTLKTIARGIIADV